MKCICERVTVTTDRETELINITDTVRDVIKRSGITAGVAYALSLHTTTGLTVNEHLSDIEDDLVELIRRLVPEEDRYRHARFLQSDGQMAVNAVSHLRGALLGFECFFPVQDGEMVIGARQTIYLVELDGPQERTFVVQVLGD
jgi:secondary thiamine-phosphate synthase enzyme